MESSSGMGSPSSHIKPLAASWRPTARPGLPQPGQFASAWPESSAASPPATSQGRPSPLRRPQPLRAGHGPANAGLLQSVLSGSPAPVQGCQMHPAVLDSPDPLSGGDWAWGTPVEEGAGTAPQPEAGRGAVFHSSRDPRLAARNAAATPGTPQEQGRSPNAQAAAGYAQQTPLASAAQMLLQDPRLKGSALRGSPQQHGAWQEAAAGSPAVWQGTDTTPSQPMQSPDAHQQEQGVVQPQPMQHTEVEQLDCEVGQAVWALQAADTAHKQEPDRLCEALLGTGPPSQLQGSATPGRLGLFPDLPQERGPQDAIGGSERALAADDGAACSGWQVEAFLNDMGSDEEGAEHMTAGRAGPGILEAGTAQQQGQGEHNSSELSLGNRGRSRGAGPDGHSLEDLLCEEALQQRDGQASSDMSPGQRKSPRRPGAGDGELDLAQQQRGDMQQVHDGQASSQISLGVKGAMQAEAVQHVGQLCSDRDARTGAKAATSLASECISLSRSAKSTPVGGAFGSMPDATEEAFAPDEACAVPALDSAVAQASDHATSAPQMECRAEASQPAGEPGQGNIMPAALNDAPREECTGRDVNQQASLPTAEPEPSTHMPAPVHSPSQLTGAPVGLAGSRLPPVKPATPQAPAKSVHEVSSASGQCSTLTSHTQQLRRPPATPPSHASQQAASSPSGRPRRAATPSRFKGEAAGNRGAHVHASQSQLAAASDGQGGEEGGPQCEEDAAGDERGEPEAPAAHAGNADVMPAEIADLGGEQGSGMVPSELRTGSDAAEQHAAASRQSSGAQDVKKQRTGRKRKQAPTSSNAINK